MNRGVDEGEPTGPLDSLVAFGRDSVRHPTRAELDAGLREVRQRLEAGRVRRHRIVGAAAVVVLVALPAVWWFSASQFGPSEPALTHRIVGGTVLDGGYLRESGDRGITLSFSEGSRFDFTPGTRGRLRAVDDDRTRVAVENGSVAVRVTPSSGRRWEVEVGPFLVTVTGTAFTVSWDPKDEQFELRLQHGRVVVSGPVSGGDLTLTAGQRLVVSLPKAETVITEMGSEAARASTPTPTPRTAALPSPSNEALAVEAPVSGTAEKRRGVSVPIGAKRDAAPHRRRWADDVARGRWDVILSDVRRDGVESVLNTASSEELFAVTSAARYRRQTALARQALLAQRRRFPQSARALEAAFLLGRVEEAGGHGPSRAISWYDEYLTQAPTGAYAAEALGRKMTLVSKASGALRAQPIARDYLRRFPGGSYAGPARALLDERVQLDKVLPDEALLDER